MAWMLFWDVSCGQEIREDLLSLLSVLGTTPGLPDSWGKLLLFLMPNWGLCLGLGILVSFKIQGKQQYVKPSQGAFECV